MPDECLKARERRLRDPNFAERYFVGHGLDVGGGSDGLEKQEWPGMLSCRTWDMPDGDAQMLATIPAEAYDFVHSSHCLEHMVDPVEALAHWCRVCKPGGYITVLVPDEDMYEQGVFPSTFNGDHKWTFTPHKAPSWSPRSINVLSLLQRLGPGLEVIKVESIHGSYDWQATERHDQTGGAAECAIEIVLRKRPSQELRDGGRFAAWHPVAP
jgi:SAM-dependent methyltransferase